MKKYINIVHSVNLHIGNMTARVHQSLIWKKTFGAILGGKGEKDWPEIYFGAMYTPILLMYKNWSSYNLV